MIFQKLRKLGFPPPSGADLNLCVNIIIRVPFKINFVTLLFLCTLGSQLLRAHWKIFKPVSNTELGTYSKWKIIDVQVIHSAIRLFIIIFSPSEESSFFLASCKTEVRWWIARPLNQVILWLGKYLLLLVNTSTSIRNTSIRMCDFGKAHTKGQGK